MHIRIFAFFSCGTRQFSGGPGRILSRPGKAPWEIAPARGFLFPVSQPQPGIGGFRYRAARRTRSARQAFLLRGGLFNIPLKKAGCIRSRFYKPLKYPIDFSGRSVNNERCLIISYNAFTAACESADIGGESLRGDFNDLTKGGVTKQLVRYAIPMVVTSLLQACYSMADLLIAGHFIGSSGISAINNSSQIVLILTNIAIGLTTGGTILIGQCFGAGSRERQKKATGTLVTLSMGLGALCAVIFFLAAEPMLRALGAPSLEEAKIYLQTCSVGLVFVFGYNALSSVLRAVGNSKQPFYFIAAAAIINVALDLFLMGYCRMGTLGAAVATTAAQGVSFLSALFYLLGRKELFQLKLEFLKIRVNELLVILRLGIPGAVQMTIAGVSWLVVTFLINQYGVDVSAGNGVSIKIKDFCQLFTSAMATSASAMIAQTLGAGLYDRAKKVTDTAMKITVAMSLTIIVLVELLAPQLAGLFTSDENVRLAAVQNLRIEIVGQVFYAVFMVYHALAIGAGHTAFAMASSFVNCIVFRVVLAAAFNHFWGLTGIYLACMIAPASSVPLGYFYTRSNVWRRSLV